MDGLFSRVFQPLSGGWKIGRNYEWEKRAGRGDQPERDISLHVNRSYGVSVIEFWF